jgi:ubiquinone/menaquinone biosynthesis C-methylase UbiE
MGFYSDVVVPYCIEFSCGMKALAPEREKVTAGLSGRVLEIGFGSGLNLPFLPRGVSELLAVDPSERARKIGRKRIDGAACPITFVGLDAERIDHPDQSADAALSTFTLCTIPDGVRALREVKRILKPGARLHFLEHGRAPDAKVARWQDRLNGMQRVIAGGCNINRDMRDLLEEAGFRIESFQADYFPGMPRTHGYLCSGVALA